MSRKIERMHPKLHEKYLLFDKKMMDACLFYMVTSVDRTILHQMALYVQGRLPLNDVNMVRIVAKLPEIRREDNNIVTWTLNSPHVTNMYDEALDNDLSRAFDIALLKYERPHWDIKISVNDNEIPDYEEAGQIGVEVGLTWGGCFKDYCHFQVEL